MERAAMHCGARRMGHRPHTPRPDRREPARNAACTGGRDMFMHNKRLQYTVHVHETNPGLANLMLEQFGGPQGELAAAMRYFTQAIAEEDPGRKDLLLQWHPLRDPRKPYPPAPSTAPEGREP